MQEGAKAATAAVPGEGDSPRGLMFAFSAYLLWGFLPLYMKAVDYIPPLEVVAHRVLWSVPVAGVVLLALGRTSDLKAAFRAPRTLVMAALTATIIGANWAIYVWSIMADRAIEAALGYYINPLVTVMIGAIFLGERFNRYQVVSIALAAVAIGVLTIAAGGLPWVSLSLAFTFAAYGYFRKTLPIGPSQGFFLEVLILGVPSIAYIVWLEATGQGSFFTSFENAAMLALSGPVTAVPLLLYAFGAKLLRISTIGMMQYIAPTVVAAIAVFVFGEPFGLDRIIAFALIWVALALFTWSMFFASPAVKKQPAA